MKSEILDTIRHQLIVSCQALADEPLHSDFIMMKMAVAAREAGAKGIRANSIVDIERIKSEVDLPLIGIIKQEYPHSLVYITPSLVEVKALIDSQCEIIALDATSDLRPAEDLPSLVSYIKTNSNKLIMADCRCLTDVKRAISLDFDIISSTLVPNGDNYFDLLSEMIDVTHQAGKFFIAEGNLDSPKKAKKALTLGADSIVVGTAITRPQEICKKYIKEIKER